MHVLLHHYQNTLNFEDETIGYGIEVVTQPLNLNDSIRLLQTFFQDLEHQKIWFFDKSTSIHINIGTKQKSKWNIIKGFIMLSDYNLKFSFQDLAIVLQSFLMRCWFSGRTRPCQG